MSSQNVGGLLGIRQQQARRAVTTLGLAPADGLSLLRSPNTREGHCSDVQGMIMLPLVAPVLPLWRIAEFWSRELANVRQGDEVFAELLSCFWMDELHVTGAVGNKKVDRRIILKLVNRRRVHPGFSLIERPEDRPGLEKSPSGEVIVDLTKYIVLPADDTTWTDELVEAAYAEMAKMPFGAFDELVTPGFMAFCTTREALGAYCKAKGYALPQFWFGPGDTGRKWNTRREREVEVWFKELVKGPKVKPRAGYLAEAQRTFGGMPEDAFDRIWASYAPDTWKKPGPVVRRKRDELSANAQNGLT